MINIQNSTAASYDFLGNMDDGTTLKKPEQIDTFEVLILNFFNKDTIIIPTEM